MSPFEAYKKYVALKLHFSSEKYDYFKFNGEVRVSRDSFEKRNDKAFFYRLAKKYEKEQLEEYLVCNFLENPENWVGEILNEIGEDSYKNWQKKIQALRYNFKQDMIRLQEEIDIGFCVDNFDNYFVCYKGDHPYLLDLALQREITIESFIIMNKILNFFPQFDKRIKQKIVWKEYKKRCLKYEPFLKLVDVTDFKSIMKEVLITPKENALL